MRIAHAGATKWRKKVKEKHHYPRIFLVGQAKDGYFF